MITVHRLLDEMLRLATEKPNQKNPGSCTYTTELDEHCLVGQAAANLGSLAEPDVLATGVAPDVGYPSLNFASFDSLLRIRKHDFNKVFPELKFPQTDEEQRAARLIADIQMLADTNKTPWSIAVSHAQAHRAMAE